MLSQDAETRAKNDAFQFYRSAGPGRKLHQNLQDEKDKLFDAKQRVKQVTRRVNAAKAQIDAVRAQLEDKRNQRGTNDGAAGNRKSGAKQMPQERDEVVDEEEFILMTAEREAKRDYRSLSETSRTPSRSSSFLFAVWSCCADASCVSLRTGTRKRATLMHLVRPRMELGLTPWRDQRSARMISWMMARNSIRWRWIE